ncbi:MAG: amidase [Acetobacteraceae bacterium]
MVTVTDDLVRLYADHDALALGEMVRNGQVTAAELVETALSVIDRINPKLNAVVHRLGEMAHAQLKAGVARDAPFAGVPYLLKELASQWEGAPLTNSCAWLRNVRAPADSEATRRIKAAGFVLVGKSNAPENGWAITAEPRLYGATHNPWRADVTPGGSSGGSAAAVAAGLVPLAEASDGAGSIRVPASCCGVIGLKPSRGRVTLAPFGDYWYGGACFLCVSRTVRDTAGYLDALAGSLPGDPYTPPVPAAPWRDLAERPPKHLHIGFTVTPPDGSAIDPEAVRAVKRTAQALERLGHTVEEHNMALNAALAWRTYTRMTTVESAMIFGAMEPLVGRPVTEADVEPVTWAIIQRGHSQSAVQHATDVNALRVMSREVAADLLPYDAYLTPTLTQKPRPLGYWNMAEPDLDRYNAKWTDAVFTFPFNFSGLPAMSLPLHWSADGLPIGVQFVGRYGDEATLLALARVLEQEIPWRDRRPPIHV